MMELAAEVLVPVWIHLPRKGSADYKRLVGAGVFAADMPQVVYASDMTDIVIPSPANGESVLYEPHHSCHAYVLNTICDGHGYTRLTAGTWIGSTRDSVAIENVGLTDILKEYVVHLFERLAIF